VNWSDYDLYFQKIDKQVKDKIHYDLGRPELRKLDDVVKGLLKVSPKKEGDGI